MIGLIRRSTRGLDEEKKLRCALCRRALLGPQSRLTSNLSAARRNQVGAYTYIRTGAQPDFVIGVTPPFGSKPTGCASPSGNRRASPRGRARFRPRPRRTACTRGALRGDPRGNAPAEGVPAALLRRGAGGRGIFRPPEERSSKRRPEHFGPDQRATRSGSVHALGRSADDSTNARSAALFYRIRSHTILGGTAPVRWSESYNVTRRSS